MEEAPIAQIPNKEEIINTEQKIFELISDKGNKFILTFNNSKSTSLLISAIFDTGLVKKFFEAEYTLEKIKDNKAFSIYDSIDEILMELFPLIEEGKVYLKENEGNIIKIEFYLPFKKYKNLDFIINEKKKTSTEIIDELYNIIFIQNKEINNLKSKFDEVKEKFNKINDNNEKLIKEYTELNQRIIKIEKENAIKENMIINTKSSMFNSIEDIDFIIKRLKYDKKLKEKKILLNLLFKATKDGQNASDFHRKCDGKVQQLIFIKTTEGEIFGGYTKIGFRSRGNATKDNNAFVFSFLTKKIYNVKKDKNAIWDSKEYGPCFYSNGNYVFYIPSKMFDDNSNTCTLSESHFEGMSYDYELNNGEYNFNIQEIEVFQVLYSY